MSDPFVRRAQDVPSEVVAAGDGLEKAVLVDESDGAPTLALRRFTLAAGGSVPPHTNDVEHEQYVLSGEYVVGLGETEQTVSAGDTLHIPAGTVHWYRNESESEVSFLCAVPTGDDSIELVEK